MWVTRGGDEGLLISNYLFCIRAKKVNIIMREGFLGGFLRMANRGK